jgi:GMP synthase-like glutamine amidotransferase
MGEPHPSPFLSMKPVLVFRHSATEGPGHFATFLERHGVDWRLVKLDEGEPVPATAEPFAGLGFMGGPMSVNDDLPWIEPTLALIRDAVNRRVPVIGHCLGGQLLSKALGGLVRPNPVKEIGWCRVDLEDTPLAREWFGLDAPAFTTFQWHAETFSLPPGAERILRGEHCANQAFVVDGRHLGMQCHVEMTPELVRSWCETGSEEIAASRASPAVQAVGRIESEAAERLPVLSDVASRLYERWAKGLAV